MTCLLLCLCNAVDCIPDFGPEIVSLVEKSAVHTRIFLVFTIATSSLKTNNLIYV